MSPLTPVLLSKAGAMEFAKNRLYMAEKPEEKLFLQANGRPNG
jgi:hypothetical protein